MHFLRFSLFKGTLPTVFIFKWIYSHECLISIEACCLSKFSKFFYTLSFIFLLSYFSFSLFLRYEVFPFYNLVLEFLNAIFLNKVKDLCGKKCWDKMILLLWFSRGFSNPIPNEHLLIVLFLALRSFNLIDVFFVLNRCFFSSSSKLIKLFNVSDSLFL